MVQQALNRHSAIAIPPETKFFFSLVGHSKHNQIRHLERLNKDLGIHLELPNRGLGSVVAYRTFFEEMANQYLSRLNKEGVRWFGEKTPEHTGHWARIRQLYPESKILILYRDGRDVALSLAKTPWMSGGLYVSFIIWLYYQRVVMQIRESGLPNLYFARYEDIVANPEKELTSILNFLELPYEPLVAEGYGNREGIPEREFLWKANALGKITPNRVANFRSELTGKQIATLERLGQLTLKEFGYPLITDGRNRLSLNFCLKLSYRMTAFIAHLPWYSLFNEIADQIFLRLTL